jgi:hypothetical protein
MRWFYKLPLRFRSLFRKDRAEQELCDELRFPLEELTGEKLAKGMRPEEARYAALRDQQSTVRQDGDRVRCQKAGGGCYQGEPKGPRCRHQKAVGGIVMNRVASKTISKVSGASFSADADWVTHSPTWRSSTTRCFSTKSTNSQMLMGESQTSLASFCRARLTLAESLPVAS